MRLPRIRVSIPIDLAAKAREYAEQTGRDLPGLVAEALRQIMARYPVRRQGAETDLDVLAAKVAAILAPQVPAGTFRGEIPSGPNPAEGATS